MAVHPSGSGCYHRLADDAALTLPNGDWVMAGWVKIGGSPGSAPYLLSWGAYSAAPSYNVWKNGSDLMAHIEDTAVTWVNDKVIASGFWSVTAWQHFAMRRAGSDFRAYVDGSQSYTVTPSAMIALNVSGQFTFGNRSDLGATRDADNSYAGWAKWDTDIGTEAITALASGLPPLALPGSLAWYDPMEAGVGRERIASITTSQSGVIADESPPIVYPSLYVVRAVSGASAAITGTAAPTITESDVVTGGKTIIITLTGDTWKAAGTGPIGSTADTQAIIDGLDSAQSEGAGWNAEVRDKELTTAVARTLSTVCTITLSAAAAYDITATETITVTVPTAALITGAAAITASPTFTVTSVAVGFLAYPNPRYAMTGGMQPHGAGVH